MIPNLWANGSELTKFSFELHSSYKLLIWLLDESAEMISWALAINSFMLGKMRLNALFSPLNSSFWSFSASSLSLITFCLASSYSNSFNRSINFSRSSYKWPLSYADSLLLLAEYLDYFWIEQKGWSLIFFNFIIKKKEEMVWKKLKIFIIAIQVCTGWYLKFTKLYRFGFFFYTCDQFVLFDIYNLYV